MNEQELFGLMAIAQEQQHAAALVLRNLEQQQAQLTKTIEQARQAVEAIKVAGEHSAGLVERSTQVAVERAVSGALGRITEQAKSALADAVTPAVNALQGVTGRAVGAEKTLRDSASWIGWKWGAVCVFTACGLLAAIVGLSMLLVPSPKEIAALRANVAALEAKGGKVQLSTCGPKSRLCARVDPNEVGTTWRSDNNKNEKWIILNGY